MGPKPRIDPDKLRVAIRRLRKDRLLDMLEHAIDLLPQTRLCELVDGHLDDAALRPARGSAASFVAEVRELHQATLRGDHYDSFDVNSKNYTETSPGTASWIADCERLFQRSARFVHKAPPAALREALELLFDLLARIDAGEQIIFFADEAGSWQVGVDWDEVLPTWLQCLSATADAEEYAQQVIRLHEQLGPYDGKGLFTKARKVGTAAQRRALRGL